MADRSEAPEQCEAMMTSADIQVADVAKTMTLTVRIKGRRQFAVRVWLATQLMKVTAAVIGTRLDLIATLEK